MNNLLIYILKTVAGLSMFALVYRFSLSRDVNFRIRRVYLLVSVSLSMLLPLFTFSLPFGNYSIPSVVLDEIVVYSNGIRLIKESSNIPITYYLKLLYFSVSGFIFLRLLINTVMILFRVSKSQSHSSEGVRLYNLNDKNISYSFFRNVFIGESAEKDDRERIIAHEKVHALQLHSLDVLYIELFSGLFWFNPLIWWYRDEIRNVHEYLADEGALRSGVNLRSYQITLLEHLIGSASFSITNNFNYSLIKNRIAMMNKEKNGRKNTWKVYLLIPVTILISIAFACTQQGKDRGIANKTAYYEVDQTPEYPGGFAAMSQFIATNLKYPEEAVSKGFSGKVLVQFIVGTDGRIINDNEDFRVLDKDNKESKVTGNITVSGFIPGEKNPTENADFYADLLKKEAVRVVSMLPAFEKPGMAGGNAVPVVFVIPINFVLK
jgi:hypothetical protein